MSKRVWYARAIVWTLLVSALAACAAPPPASPTPTHAALPTLTSQPPTPAPPLMPTPTPRRAMVTPVPPVAPSPTPRAHQFDEVDARRLLATLFPDIKLVPNGDEFRVNDNPNWTLWINSRAEGQFTQTNWPELAVIVANEAPHISAADAQRTAPWGSFLAIFQKYGGKIEVAQRSFLFPTEMSPVAFDAKIDRVVDFDHDDQDELLITTTAKRLGFSTTAAFLYQWNDPAFAEIWSAPSGEDNTGAINQPNYFASVSDARLSDVNGDGLDEIILDTTRVDYARDAQGLADTDRETARRTERRVFTWGGTSFLPDPARATPLPPLPSPTR
ncbi:MAG: hypothetical protein HY782_10215 [Chloroflexi bacterium]|nr:hypothetical protein [Chloroflexota bacterium]